MGKEKCLGVITDNASNMKKTCKLLQADEKFKSLPIAYYSCVSHTLNLLMLDVVEVRTCSEIENISKAIIKNIISTHILKGNKKHQMFPQTSSKNQMGLIHKLFRKSYKK